MDFRTPDRQGPPSKGACMTLYHCLYEGTDAADMLVPDGMGQGICHGRSLCIRRDGHAGTSRRWQIRVRKESMDYIF